ncbi:hypothetical protein [Mucilaginibacter flavus]|uniref:DUF6438 domain-containing protein n=1 Tax=Mucilaginibacter flavus TaxID=931504 RepID=UPI0025B338C3|nr:hypothetical protein [Mucilaginibacter flavus]MDN3580469.1 hypothetical protein [Mucilaginibacter flavus]
MPHLRLPTLFCLLIIALPLMLITACQNKTSTNSVLKIEMNLSAFGVESDGFPSVKALINLKTDSSSCKKFYYSSEYKDSVYSLSNSEMLQIHDILKNVNIKKLKNKYTVNETDQPRSTIIFYTDIGNVIVDDYGLKGEDPLQELYEIVYKL